MVSQKKAVRRRGVDIVTPPMDAGTAVIYSYTTQHRGLASSRPDFYRPVLKLDYFGSFVQKNNNKDGWCEENGFVLDEGFTPPTMGWADVFDHWFPAILVTITVLLALAAAFSGRCSSRPKKKRGQLKPKRS